MSNMPFPMRLFSLHVFGENFNEDAKKGPTRSTVEGTGSYLSKFGHMWSHFNPTIKLALTPV
jgi:hypothetical protein